MERAADPVDEWNSKYPIGMHVVVTKDLGEKINTRTRSEAQYLPSGEAVIWVGGITGAYLLERVRPSTVIDAPRVPQFDGVVKRAQEEL